MHLAPTPIISGTSATISDGVVGVYQTLQQMRKMVNAAKITPQIRQAATGLIFMTPQKDELSEVETLFNFVRDTVRYTRDIHGVETLSAPYQTLLGKIGDCDDQTMLLCALLEAIGYPTRFVIAGYFNAACFEHVYCQVSAAGQWIDCDPTEPYAMGYAPPDPTLLAFEAV